jgi:hypothetical protein
MLKFKVIRYSLNVYFFEPNAVWVEAGAQAYVAVSFPSTGSPSIVHGL